MKTIISSENELIAGAAEQIRRLLEACMRSLRAAARRAK